MDQSRTEILVGPEGMARLEAASVAVYGLGGVGGYALEALTRAGVGRLYVVDFDTVQPSNLNRQILATERTLGMKKTDAAVERVRAINPQASVEALCRRIGPDSADECVPPDVRYAVDAIDEMDPKIALIAALLARGVVSVHSMGAGCRISTGGITVADISVTSHCPLARKVRKRLKERGILKGVTCVYSGETPLSRKADAPDDAIGSISYVPGIFGLTAAGVIIRRILEG